MNSYKATLVMTYYFEYDFDHQTAAGADCDFLAIAEIGERDFELVAAWARVGVEGCGSVIGHVFDFYFVVEGHCACLCLFLTIVVKAEW